ncbi:MAG: hypothetical protein ACOWW1_05655 [archaeon]
MTQKREKLKNVWNLSEKKKLIIRGRNEIFYEKQKKVHLFEDKCNLGLESKKKVTIYP